VINYNLYHTVFSEKGLTHIYPIRQHNQLTFSKYEVSKLIILIKYPFLWYGRAKEWNIIGPCHRYPKGVVCKHSSRQNYTSHKHTLPTHTHTYCDTHTHTVTHTHCDTHAHAHAHAHAHTHTHTHTPQHIQTI